MDFNDDSELDSDCGANTRPPSYSEAESEKSKVPNPKGQGNLIRARTQALTLFELQVLHEKITAQTDVSRSGLYKLRSKAISRGWGSFRNLRLSISTMLLVLEGQRSLQPFNCLL